MATWREKLEFAGRALVNEIKSSDDSRILKECSNPTRSDVFSSDTTNAVHQSGLKLSHVISWLAVIGIIDPKKLHKCNGKGRYRHLIARESNKALNNGCFRCGSTGHWTRDCDKCSRCGKDDGVLELCPMVGAKVDPDGARMEQRMSNWTNQAAAAFDEKAIEFAESRLVMKLFCCCKDGIYEKYYPNAWQFYVEKSMKINGIDAVGTANMILMMHPLEQRGLVEFYVTNSKTENDMMIKLTTEGLRVAKENGDLMTFCTSRNVKFITPKDNIRANPAARSNVYGPSPARDPKVKIAKGKKDMYGPTGSGPEVTIGKVVSVKMKDLKAIAETAGKVHVDKKKEKISRKIATQIYDLISKLSKGKVVKE